MSDLHERFWEILEACEHDLHWTLTPADVWQLLVDGGYRNEDILRVGRR